MEQYTLFDETDMVDLLRPETPLERAFLEDPSFLEGLKWGTPRYGHPEGAVYKHIIEVCSNIDAMNLDVEMREKLRVIAFVHDTFKYCEHKGTPRDWTKHHAIFAKNFLEKYTDDKTLLKVVEFHDEAYYCWRLHYIYHNPDGSESRLNALLRVLGNDLQLYYLFFKCDTLTGDKNLAPLRWFETNIPNIDITKVKGKQ